MIGKGLDAQVIRLKHGQRHEWTPRGRIERYQDALIYADKAYFDFRKMKGELMQHNLKLYGTTRDRLTTEPAASDHLTVVIPFDQLRRNRRKR